MRADRRPGLPEVPVAGSGTTVAGRGTTVAGSGTTVAGRGTGEVA